MFSKINAAWRKVIASPTKSVPKDKTDDTVNVIMSVITLTGANPSKVLERLQERIEQAKVGPSEDKDINAIIEVHLNDNPQ